MCVWGGGGYQNTSLRRIHVQGKASSHTVWYGRRVDKQTLCSYHMWRGYRGAESYGMYAVVQWRFNILSVAERTYVVRVVHVRLVRVATVLPAINLHHGVANSLGPDLPSCAAR
jgi:hypothetical protein